MSITLRSGTRSGEAGTCGHCGMLTVLQHGRPGQVPLFGRTVAQWHADASCVDSFDEGR